MLNAKIITNDFPFIISFYLLPHSNCKNDWKLNRKIIILQTFCQFLHRLSSCTSLKATKFLAKMCYWSDNWHGKISCIANMHRINIYGRIKWPGKCHELQDNLIDFQPISIFCILIELWHIWWIKHFCRSSITINNWWKTSSVQPCLCSPCQRRATKHQHNNT